MRVELEVPDRFDFAATVLSHGWCLLPPFEVSRGYERLTTTVDLDDAGVHTFALEATSNGVVLVLDGRPRAAIRKRLVLAARRVLSLDVDLTGFYRRCASDAAFRFIPRAGTGRFLRAPSAFEDLVKLVMTTNCSWSLTTKMVVAAVERLGRPDSEGRRAFPLPAAFAAAGTARLRREVRAGYRAPYLVRIGELVDSGEVDPESWERGDVSVETLRASILSLPGAGPYVADNVLKFMGRPRGLGLDAWMRAEYARRFHGGRRVTDRTIARRYRRLGSHAAIALWCELTRDWREGGIDEFEA